MPKNTPARPEFKTQTVKGSAYAYTRVDGRRVSLGRADSEEAHARYRRILAEWESSAVEHEHADRSRLTVAELAERFVAEEWRRVQAGEVKPTNAYVAEYAARALVENNETACLPVSLFGPRALKAIQRQLAKTPVATHAGRFRDSGEPKTLSRTEVNRRVNVIRRLFRWGVSEELVPATVLASLEAVRGLRAGEARETKPRTPADPQAVAATVAALEAGGRRHMAGVVRLIRWTGCRPDEVCRLTAGDIVGTPDGPELRIRNHKTRKHTNTDRVVVLNDEAIQIVRDALAAGRSIDPDRWLFTDEHGQPVTPNGLWQAVDTAADAAGVAHWTPYQLRHLAAIEMLEAGATEAEASAAIGHASGSTVIRRYSRGREKLARRAVRGIGSRESA